MIDGEKLAASEEARKLAKEADGELAVATGGKATRATGGKAVQTVPSAKDLAAGLKLLQAKVIEAGGKHPAALAALAAWALVDAIILLFWYIVFSGFAQPIQFVYSAF